MLEALSSLLTLRWTNPALLHPLPSNIERKYITNPSDPALKLELLSSTPSTSTSPTLNQRPNSTAAPILLLHGGFGSASVWLPFMSYLSTTTTTTTTTKTAIPNQIFALSLRNHGASSPVPFPSMVYETSLSDLTTDITTAITHITKQTSQTPILVGHSSAGGLIASLLSEEKCPVVPGIALLDAIPHSGNLGTYVNWVRNEPWFLPRMVPHLFHPLSPLSSVALVRRAFFGPGVGGVGEVRSDDEVREFMAWIPRYESLLWPMGMGGSFWGWLAGRPRWIDVRGILERVEMDGDRDRVLVFVGEYDRLVDPGMAKDVAADYRRGMEELRGKSEGEGQDDGKREKEKDLELEGTTGDVASGVRYVVIHGAGHHAQNDVQWETAAEVLRRFVMQL